MIGLLTLEEIHDLLRRQRVGRLACSANDRPYVVPLNYVFDGEYIYGYSVPGRKITIMREQPLVSFEIDEICDPSNWRSVIAEGVYEELECEPERGVAKRLLVNGFGDLISRGLDASPAMVLFRIRLTELSGRFEHWDA
jgi:uncharacterized protein